MVQNMCRCIAVAAVALLTTGIALAQGGKVEVIGGDIYNWGTVPPGKLTAELTVRNIGEGTLVIDTVRPSCGCTTSPIDKKILEPGESATVHVTLDASYRSGPLEKSVTIVSNDSMTPYHFVRLLATIRRSVTVTPTTTFILTDARKGVEGAAAPVTIQNTGDTPLKIGPPKIGPSGNALIRFTMTEARELAPGESMQIEAYITPNDDRMIYGSVTIETSAPEAATLTFGVTGTMAPPPDAQVGHR